MRDDETKFPASVVVTHSLAQELFPRSNPLGQIVYFGKSQPSRIVGIVEQAQTPSAAQTRDPAQGNAASFFPYQFLGSDTLYVVRTVPGRLVPVMKIAQDKLFQATPQRIVMWARTFYRGSP